MGETAEVHRLKPRKNKKMKMERKNTGPLTPTQRLYSYSRILGYESSFTVEFSRIHQSNPPCLINMFAFPTFSETLFKSNAFSQSEITLMRAQSRKEVSPAILSRAHS